MRLEATRARSLAAAGVRVISLSIACLIARPMQSAAADAPPAHDYSEYAAYSDADWERLRVDVCSREKGHSDAQRTNCDNLKAGKDGWVEPETRFVNLLSTLAPEIRATAKLYDIDPRALVGAILAEDTINDSPADRLQMFLVTTKITPTGTIGGKGFTFGLGQLNGSELPDVEKLAAQVEGRPERSYEAATAEAATVLGSIKYTAAFIRRAQDEYAKYGIDIRNRPEILVSLYNFGLTAPDGRPRAAITKEEGRDPQLSYLGLFTLKYLPSIETIVAGGELTQSLTQDLEGYADIPACPPLSEMPVLSYPVTTSSYPGTSSYPATTSSYPDPGIVSDPILPSTSSYPGIAPYPGPMAFRFPFANSQCPPGLRSAFVGPKQSTSSLFAYGMGMEFEVKTTECGTDPFTPATADCGYRACVDANGKSLEWMANGFSGLPPFGDQSRKPAQKTLKKGDFITILNKTPNLCPGGHYPDQLPSFGNGYPQWLHVRTPDGREAWIEDPELQAHSETLPLTPESQCREDRNPTCEAAVSAKMGAAGIRPSRGLSTMGVQSRTIAFDVGNNREFQAGLQKYVTDCRAKLHPASQFPQTIEALRVASKKVELLDVDPSSKWSYDENMLTFMMKECDAAAESGSKKKRAAGATPAGVPQCLSCGSEGGAIEAAHPSRKAEALAREMGELTEQFHADQVLAERVTNTFGLNSLAGMTVGMQAPALFSPTRLKKALEAAARISCIRTIYVPMNLQRLQEILPEVKPDPRWIFRGGPPSGTVEVETSGRICGEKAREGERARRKAASRRAEE